MRKTLEFLIATVFVAIATLFIAPWGNWEQYGWLAGIGVVGLLFLLLTNQSLTALIVGVVVGSVIAVVGKVHANQYFYLYGSVVYIFSAALLLAHVLMQVARPSTSHSR